MLFFRTVFHRNLTQTFCIAGGMLYHIFCSIGMVFELCKNVDIEAHFSNKSRLFFVMPKNKEIVQFIILSIYCNFDGEATAQMYSVHLLVYHCCCCCFKCYIVIRSSCWMSRKMSDGSCNRNCNCDFECMFLSCCLGCCYLITHGKLFFSYNVANKCYIFWQKNVFVSLSCCPYLSVQLVLIFCWHILVNNQFH